MFVKFWDAKTDQNWWAASERRNFVMRTVLRGIRGGRSGRTCSLVSRIVQPAELNFVFRNCWYCVLLVVRQNLCRPHPSRSNPIFLFVSLEGVMWSTCFWMPASHIWSNLMTFLCEVQLVFVTEQVSGVDLQGIRQGLSFTWQEQPALERALLSKRQSHHILLREQESVVLRAACAQMLSR